ncbi:MAG: hypothetical protein QXP31_03965 [Pyrobaculum sp.]
MKCVDVVPASARNGVLRLQSICRTPGGRVLIYATVGVDGRASTDKSLVEVELGPRFRNALSPQRISC